MHDEIRGMTEVNKAVKALRSKIFDPGEGYQ